MQPTKPRRAESTPDHVRRCSNMVPTRSRRFAYAVALTTIFHATVALADARVDVEVKDASGRLASGQVTLSVGSVSKSCTTVGGRCSITLAAGRYQVRLVPTNGAASTSDVSVPASGSIRLTLAITPATAPVPPPAPAPKPTTTTQPQEVSPAAPTRLRDVSRGRRLAVQGSVLDQSGRLTNATITLQQKGRAVAQTTCVGGRFAMYDLASGTYDVVAVAPSGTRATSRLKVKTKLLRPTLRLVAP